MYTFAILGIELNKKISDNIHYLGIQENCHECDKNIFVCQKQIIEYKRLENKALSEINSIILCQKCVHKFKQKNNRGLCLIINEHTH